MVRSIFIIKIFIFLYFFTLTIVNKASYSITIKSGEEYYNIIGELKYEGLIEYVLDQKTDYIGGVYVIKETYVTNYQLIDVFGDNPCLDKYKIAFRNLKRSLKRYLTRWKNKYAFAISSSNEDIKCPE